MAEEITTKKVENLTENTEPADTDVYLFGASGGNAIKKIKWSNIVKKLRNLLIVNNATTTEPGYAMDARQGKLLQDGIDNLGMKMGKYKILDIQEVSLTSTGATEQGKSVTVSANFTAVPGATKYMPILTGFGWLSPNKPAISGTKITCTLLNASSGVHSGSVYFTILALQSI